MEIKEDYWVVSEVVNKLFKNNNSNNNRIELNQKSKDYKEHLKL